MNPILVVSLFVLISLLAGFLSALIGIGGGLIFVPLFHYLLKMNMHQAIGTSLAIIVPTALVGAWKHEAHDFVNWKVFFFAAIFSMIGGYIGAHVSVGLDSNVLRRVFGVFLLFVALKMLFWK